MPLNPARFDLVTLRLFVAAVRHGSLTAGGTRLGMSLAAASKRIAELEAHVGTALLERSKRGVRPTAAGQVLLPHAIEMVSRLEQLAVAMDDVHGGAAGVLRLWANTSAFGGFLPALLGEFSRAHPGVVLDLEDAISEDAVRSVARGAAELAVIGDNVPAEGLQTELCHVDELVLLLPRGHRLAPGPGTPPPVPIAEVLEHDLVAFSRPTSLTRQLAAEAEALAKPLRIRAQVRSFDAMGRMVAAGLGLAVLPREGAVPYARTLGLVSAPISGMRTERRLLWAMRDPASLTPAAQALLDLSRSKLRGDRRAA